MERNSGNSSGLTSLPLTSCSRAGAASSRTAAMARLAGLAQVGVLRAEAGQVRRQGVSVRHLRQRLMASNCVASSPAAWSSAGTAALFLSEPRPCTAAMRTAGVLVVQQRRRAGQRRRRRRVGPRRGGGGADGRRRTLERGDARRLAGRQFRARPAPSAPALATTSGSDGTASAASVSADAGVLIFSSPAMASSRSGSGFLAVLERCRSGSRPPSATPGRRRRGAGRPASPRPFRRRIVSPAVRAWPGR